MGLVRQRKFPIFGDGAGVWSFTHIDDAANATRLAIERAPSGIYNIVDDSRAVGAKPPYHLPAWLGQLVIGEAGMSMMTNVRGSSNAKAKRALSWQPIYANWEDGFRPGMASGSPKVTRV